MASVSNVQLQLGSGTTERPATVTGTVNFDASDVGKTFRLSIDLWGEDLAGDKVPAGDAAGDDLLYSFLWIGSGAPLIRKYRSIAVSAAGSQSFTETRNVPAAKLDEDAGTIDPNAEADINTPLPPMPRRDEVYARVTVALPPATARSATVIAGIGV
jgi:hypothetical protein